MKIQKQFKDLILSGTKKYEFRNESNKSGFYKIGEDIFFLKLLKTRNFYDFNDLITFIKANYDYDYDSLNWVEKNSVYFAFDYENWDDSCTTEYYICVYEWINLKNIEEHLKEILWVEQK